MKNYCDNYEMNLASPDAVIEHLQKDENLKTWETVNVNDIKIIALPNMPMLLDEIRTEYNIVGASDEAIQDTMMGDGTRLLASIKGESFLIRDTAIKSLLDRAKINGSVLTKVTPAELSQILNICLNKYECQGLILKNNEKISAFHSGDKYDYSVLDQVELIDSLEAMLDKKFPGHQCIEAYVSHSFTTMTYLLPEHAEELKKKYPGLDIMNYDIGIRYMTSDTGISSANLNCIIMNHKNYIPLGMMTKTWHKNRKTVANFAADIEGIYAKLDETAENFAKLNDILIKHPANCMTLVCKKLGLPKKEALEAVDMYKSSCESTATANEIYWAISEILFFCKAQNKNNERKQLLLEDKVANALTIDWKAYDMVEAKW